VEDTIKPGETPSSAPASQTADTTPEESGNGRTAQERIRELVAKNKELEAKLGTPATPSVTPVTTPAPDEDWKRKVELEISVPSVLKDKVEDMTAYWSRNPGLTKSEVFKIFTPVESLVEQAKKADEEAIQSRSGGTSNPSARQEQTDLSKLSTADLRTQLEDEIKRGMKV
jgi:hypothetical protein